MGKRWDRESSVRETLPTEEHAAGPAPTQPHHVSEVTWWRGIAALQALLTILLWLCLPSKSLPCVGHVPTSSVLVFVFIAVWGFFLFVYSFQTGKHH